MKKWFGALAVSLIAANAHAQGFVEFGIGQSTVDIDTSAPAGVSVSTDEKDTSWSVSGGYMFHPVVGAEIGYRNLGEASISATNGINTATGTMEADGFTVGAVGRIPVADKFSIVPRAGLYLWESEGDITLNGTQLQSFDDDGSDIYFGVGAEYAFAPNAFAGAHFARFELEETDVDVLELRVGFKF
jgi:hypothetical protein